MGRYPNEETAEPYHTPRIILVGCCGHSDFCFDQWNPPAFKRFDFGCGRHRGHSGWSYVDVGQGDCELIRTPDDQTILIDAGTNATGDALVHYLEKLGVTQIDTLIATHPHEDHIGGMDEVIHAFPIGEIYLPKIADSQTPTTRTYERLLEAIDDRGLSITPGHGGMTILDENGIKLEFLAPNSDSYAELNSYSIVAKLTCGQKSFLFTGDAEADSEDEMLDWLYNITDTLRYELYYNMPSVYD